MQADCGVTGGGKFASGLLRHLEWGLMYFMGSEEGFGGKSSAAQSEGNKKPGDHCGPQLTWGGYQAVSALVETL